MSSTRFDCIPMQNNPPYQLLYVASSCYDKDWNSLLHTHTCTEMFYCIHGRGRFHTAGHTFDIKKDDLVIVNAGVEHAESSTPNHPLEYLVLGVQGLSFHFGEASSEYSVLNFGENRDEIFFYLKTLLQETTAQQENYQRMCQQILDILLIHMQRIAYVKISTNTPELGKRRAANYNCALIRQYIDEHFSEAITLDSLAKMIHINKCYLVRAFQKEYGTTPINYLIERRLEEARFLLKNTDYSTSQIVSILGFSSPSYFSQCFRRRENMTPSQYREKYGQSSHQAAGNES